MTVIVSACVPAQSMSMSTVAMVGLGVATVVQVAAGGVLSVGVSGVALRDAYRVQVSECHQLWLSMARLAS